MENYEKGETRILDTVPDLLDGLHGDAVEMRVNAGSKIRNLMGYSLGKMNQSEVRQIIWNGSGPAINKTISLAEIMKRKIKGLHQITRLGSKRIEEYWEPKVEGLERLKVNRDLPVIAILLSKDTLDPEQPGYQAPGSKDPAWITRSQGPADGATPTGGKQSRQEKRKVGKSRSDSRPKNRRSNTSNKVAANS